MLAGVALCTSRHVALTCVFVGDSVSSYVLKCLRIDSGDVRFISCVMATRTHGAFKCGETVSKKLHEFGRGRVVVGCIC